MEERTVKILGVKYKILDNVPFEDMPDSCDGCMDHTMKTIKLAKIEPDRNSVKNLGSYKRKVLRHEIIHAFLFESGLWNNSGNVTAWGQSEEITDWIAIQFPKMLKAFRVAGCVD